MFIILSKGVTAGVLPSTRNSSTLLTPIPGTANVTAFDLDPETDGMGILGPIIKEYDLAHPPVTNGTNDTITAYSSTEGSSAHSIIRDYPYAIGLLVVIAFIIGVVVVVVLVRKYCMGHKQGYTLFKIRSFKRFGRYSGGIEMTGASITNNNNNNNSVETKFDRFVLELEFEVTAAESRGLEVSGGRELERICRQFGVHVLMKPGLNDNRRVVVIRGTDRAVSQLFDARQEIVNLMNNPDSTSDDNYLQVLTNHYRNHQMLSDYMWNANRETVNLLVDMRVGDQLYLESIRLADMNELQVRYGTKIAMPSDRKFPKPDYRPVTITGSPDGVLKTYEGVRQLLPVHVWYELHLNVGLTSHILDVSSQPMRDIQRKYALDVFVGHSKPGIPCSVHMRGPIGQVDQLRAGIAVIQEYIKSHGIGRLDLTIHSEADAQSSWSQIVGHKQQHPWPDGSLSIVGSDLKAVIAAKREISGRYVVELDFEVTEGDSRVVDRYGRELEGLGDEFGVHILMKPEVNRKVVIIRSTDRSVSNVFNVRKRIVNLVKNSTAQTSSQTCQPINTSSSLSSAYTTETYGTGTYNSGQTRRWVGTGTPNGYYGVTGQPGTGRYYYGGTT
ncbi:unnamed protein product [Oppiella nova]|uniref:Protein bicaudal C homolog 1 KH-like domain-containing protein n=1 Tax=Oppiella nova TaxID=334625 RepID=A0A7R9M0I7_9ACAR|nr:unnamed protein product [Oppiella nova]CAG2168761.1 unnamed protein product [Oppiella nova]